MLKVSVRAGKQLLQRCPEVASMTGAQLVAVLGKGSEMRKAWEGGSGGSNRLVQCTVSQGQAYIVYGRGWLRKAVQHPIDRYLTPHAWHDAWRTAFSESTTFIAAQ